MRSSIFAASSRVVFYGGSDTSESTLATCDFPFDCERPRINDLGEVVWTQRLNVDDKLFAIYSSDRGLITAGYVTRDPDINNAGEVIWRYGDGGSGPNGIQSNVLGVVYTSSAADPGYDTPRINNNGETIASIGNNGKRVWSNIRGDLPTTGRLALETEVNDHGEVVYRSYDILAGDVETNIIYSTARGDITGGSVRAGQPDINNLGEIVWHQFALPQGNSQQWEIWSNIRGKIGDGVNPSINDAGEVVWMHSDGNDFEVYSSIRGQITSNNDSDDWPHINNSGDIVWVRREPGSIPEPSTVLLAAIGMLIGLAHAGRGHRLEINPM
jgi:hypothetical protein